MVFGVMCALFLDKFLIFQKHLSQLHILLQFWVKFRIIIPYDIFYLSFDVPLLCLHRSDFLKSFFIFTLVSLLHLHLLSNQKSNSILCVPLFKLVIFERINFIILFNHIVNFLWQLQSNVFVSQIHKLLQKFLVTNNQFSSSNMGIFFTAKLYVNTVQLIFHLIYSFIRHLLIVIYETK